MSQSADLARTVPTRLGDLHVQQYGTGPVLVLWHSLFVDSSSWERLLEPLARDHRLIVIDGPSHGRSAPVLRRFTLGECPGCAEDVLNHLGITGPVDWLGNAWGGHVGILFAASRPSRVRSLVTIGTPIRGISPAERRRYRALVALYRLTGPIRPLVRQVGDALLGPHARTADPDAFRVVTEPLRRADRRTMHSALWSLMLTRLDLSAAVSEVAAPTLFVAGADDQLWSPAEALAASTGLPHGGCAVVPGAGHVAPLLENDPALLDLLRAFWRDPADFVKDSVAPLTVRLE